MCIRDSLSAHTPGADSDRDPAHHRDARHERLVRERDDDARLDGDGATAAGDQRLQHRECASNHRDHLHLRGVEDVYKRQPIGYGMVAS